MSQLVICIVALVIVLQFIFFIMNVVRMREYKNIFAEDYSWGISHDSETNFVSGINGSGNKVFESIKDSINKYLANNLGSVIDFSLLKDAVDRHCDAVENDINTLTPTPLYCGLAGTMAGVIVGLGSLIHKGAITELLTTGAGEFDNAAQGVNDLLSGVALAMIASIVGIVLTTVASLLFKVRKLEGESGKNTFLAWLQAELLPELPSDTADAMRDLVRGLNRFNNKFAQNTTTLGETFDRVNESYRIQGDIIQAVHDMDVVRMARANVRVLHELQGCTDRLEVFNQYLDDIHGYTDAIHTFTTQFEKEANRLHVLEEIRDYFTRHQAEIARSSADADVALQEALKTLRRNATKNTNELNNTFVKQAEEFKTILEDERKSFEQINQELCNRFSSQLNQIPMLEKQLAEIAGIPAKLDRLIERMERANSQLASQVSGTMTRTAKDMMASVSSHGEDSPRKAVQILPGWMKWTIVVSSILIAIACLSNAVYNIWLTPNNTPVSNIVSQQ